MHNPQEIAELITVLSKNKGISVNKMLQECGVGLGTVGNLKAGNMPSALTLATIAKYLGISTDFLLGNYEGIENEEPKIELKNNDADSIAAVIKDIIEGSGLVKPGEELPPELKEHFAEMIRLSISLVQSSKNSQNL